MNLKHVAIHFLIIFCKVFAQFDDESEVYEELIQNGPCNIPIEFENELSQDEFIARYAYKTPVIIRTSSDTNSKFIEKTNIQNLLQDYGSKLVTVGTANTYSYKKYNIRFDTYVNNHVLMKNKLNKYGNETFYLFGDFYNITEWLPLLNLYKIPQYTLPNHTHALSFGVAALGTGVPFHFHGPGFAECLHGRKRWFLTEPDKQPNFNPDKSTLQWYLEDYKTLKASNIKLYECVLKPGEIIYFPDKWWHATLNINKAVFISTFLSRIF